MIAPEVILVLDVGKTHSKISLVELSTGRLEFSCKTESTGFLATRYKALDIDHLWQWFLRKTQELVKQFNIKEIISTTHGATSALVGSHELIFPIVDYEFDQYQSVEAAYSTKRPTFTESASPNLAAGLNLGRQIYWLQAQFAADWNNVKDILMFPQYLGWYMTGVSVSEITSLGCHTDLWNYRQSKVSSLVESMQWDKYFPPILKAGELIGPISQSFARLSGLSSNTKVLNGIHDSNASLVPYLKKNNQAKNIISSGTWIVICSIGSEVCFDPLPSEMMMSMNFRNEEVPSIRFMGGREWEKLQTEYFSYDLSTIEAIIEIQSFPLPAFVEAGPFSGRTSEITNEELLSSTQRAAIGCLYLALMTRYCLDKLQNNGDIVIEGSLTNNAIYLQLLQAISPNQQVQISDDQTGTTYGAACLSSSAENWPGISMHNQNKLEVKGFSEYYKNWLKEL